MPAGPHRDRTAATSAATNATSARRQRIAHRRRGARPPPGQRGDGDRQHSHAEEGRTTWGAARGAPRPASTTISAPVPQSSMRVTRVARDSPGVSTMRSMPRAIAASRATSAASGRSCRLGPGVGGVGRERRRGPTPTGRPAAEQRRQRAGEPGGAQRRQQRRAQPAARSDAQTNGAIGSAQTKLITHPVGDVTTHARIAAVNDSSCASCSTDRRDDGASPGSRGRGSRRAAQASAAITSG